MKIMIIIDMRTYYILKEQQIDNRNKSIDLKNIKQLDLQPKHHKNLSFIIKNNNNKSHDQETDIPNKKYEIPLEEGRY